MPETNMPLIEPVQIDDDLCSGLAIIEPVWTAAARLVFYAEQTCFESRSQTFVVKRKIVLPVDGLESLVLHGAEHIARLQRGPLRRR